MSDIDIRITGRAGRITLTRPKALNAMTYDMCLAIEAALDDWATQDAVALVIIDAEGDRAFCSGGDIAELYETGTKGDYAYGRRFWADEYRLNNKMFSYAKPIVSLLQGFTMGGGVGIGCHGSHRIVGDSSQVAMPECGIGLVPDVGGTLILARAPGRLGEYLGTTGTRMEPDDAIFAGFADTYVPEDQWPALIAKLESSGDVSEISGQTPPSGPLRDQIDAVDRLFAGEDLGAVLSSLQTDDSEFAKDALKKISRVSPLSAACCIEIVRRLRDAGPTMAAALDLEYRFTYRAMAQGDFLEGIRAAIIDKDRNPRWQHASGQVPPAAISDMLHPLGADAVKL
ncbi:putative enoyl-CoA hydratase echA8 [Sulfitobacter sp. THAF37]|uniref:enoyl-CoA hydratase/isomerase family protein n=1 Tax=Sulfitobacter sp. THAF37 TaxID=2587855 RepID=UPI0012689207|nr:enoyl-CoA hydratase/isomerase family protein [Sulfitobacter sp. THAF37]QFT59690.1 putative enoyl-CoA hydratase echA8 [Sulfitobacter sp. THAF37]